MPFVGVGTILLVYSIVSIVFLSHRYGCRWSLSVDEVEKSFLLDLREDLIKRELEKQVQDVVV